MNYTTKEAVWHILQYIDGNKTVEYVWELVEAVECTLCIQDGQTVNGLTFNSDCIRHEFCLDDENIIFTVWFDGVFSEFITDNDGNILVDKETKII